MSWDIAFNFAFCLGMAVWSAWTALARVKKSVILTILLRAPAGFLILLAVNEIGAALTGGVRGESLLHGGQGLDFVAGVYMLFLGPIVVAVSFLCDRIWDQVGTATYLGLAVAGTVLLATTIAALAGETR